MKKIDKLILSAFCGLLVLTFCVAFFVLLMQFLLFHFDELIGKKLGWAIYAQLASYIGMLATKKAFPLAILLASIMAMGKLGEHHELTALKSAGISLPRLLWPLFVLVFLLSVLAFFSNSYIVPRASLNVVSLLYDLRKKKPSVAIKEGVFYDGIPGYSIKVRKKLDDQKTLQDIMIYDHNQDRGNVSLTMAESGKLYMIQDEAYLVLELFNGHNYIEEPAQENTSGSNDLPIPQLYRNSFKAQKLIISLDSFKLERTQQEWLTDDYRTKNARQLAADVRAMQGEIQAAKHSLQAEALRDLIALGSPETTAAAAVPVDLPAAADILPFKAYAEQQHQDKPQEGEQSAADLPTAPLSLYKATDLAHIYREALKQARTLRHEVTRQVAEQKRLEKKIRNYELERHKMVAWAVTCMVVFLIGASLGAIIKKGGLGVPLLIATALIVWHYIFEMLGEKWANAAVIDTFSGAWLANGFLLLVGVFFLIQAYRDARLLEADFYAVLLERIKKYIGKALILFRRPRN